jgi:hypothetical protein
MSERRPVCSLSLDLDNLWSYMKTHGDSGWESLPTYLDLVVPSTLEVLRRYGWTITFFIVGQDAALEKNRDALASIAEAGHEIGNHSFHHEPWLHLYTEEQTKDEIERAEHAIGSATGATPRGFRGPGYSLSRATVEVLARRGYRYDGSTLPTFLGPLARAYYFRTTDLTAEEKQQRKILFGGFNDGFKPLGSYLWVTDHEELLEIPVTTMPILRLPFHFSYLLYIGTFSASLAKLYFRSALRLCRAARVEPSLLLHPLDFVGGDAISELAFFPAMKSTTEQKGALLTSLFNILGRQSQVLPMGRHADILLQRSNMNRRSLSSSPRPL